jgi:hypothetical protein
LTFKTEAYVDSGAFCSIFQNEIFEVLQLSKEQAQTKMLKAADGNLIPAYLFRLPVQIADMRLRASIAFSDKLKIGFNMLGRQTIFSAFEEIAFNEREKKVIFAARTGNRCFVRTSFAVKVRCLSVRRTYRRKPERTE